MKEYSAKEWLPSGSGLGESPLYRASDDLFFFVDIKNKLVHSVPATKGWDDKATYQFDECITRLHVVAGRTDVLAVQTRAGLALLSLDAGTLTPLAGLRHADASLDGKVRMNDGGIDARGRWWAGSMALDEETPIGRLWRFAAPNVGAERTGEADSERQNQNQDASRPPPGVPAVGLEQIDGLVYTPVPNGPVWSPDDRAMYACETPGGEVFQYDYDAGRGAATNKRPFARLDEGGMPDGLAVDVEGCVWVAANAQGRLVRYSPAGEAVAVCSVPGAKMTSCPAFGGRDMRTLFITSIAAEGSTGHVYRVDVDVPGIRRHEYRA